MFSKLSSLFSRDYESNVQCEEIGNRRGLTLNVLTVVVGYERNQVYIDKLDYSLSDANNFVHLQSFHKMCTVCLYMLIDTCNRWSDADISNTIRQLCYIEYNVC